jgi:hypothetical protein
MSRQKSLRWYVPLTAALVMTGAGTYVVPLLAGANACRNDVETRNSWHVVTGPGRGETVAGQLPGQPCLLLAAAGDEAYASADGGSTWAVSASLPHPMTAVVTQDMPAQTAFLVPIPDLSAPAVTAPGLFVSHDGGRSLTAVQGLDGRQVRALAAAPSDNREIVAVLAPASVQSDLPTPALPAPTVFVSQDFGNTFTAAPGSAGLDPAGVAVDPDTAGTLWVASAGTSPGTVAGLFESTNTGASFLVKDPGASNAVVTSKLAGGGTIVLSGAANGLRRSVDGGTSFSTLYSGHDVTELVLEYNHPSAMMAVADGRLERSSTGGRTFRPQADGIPPACHPEGLTGDNDQPSTFLIRCSTTGALYRYRGDGSDLSLTDEPVPSNSPPATAAAGQALPMRILRSLRIPTSGAADSGSIAFDGQDLYYTDGASQGAIDKMSATTGAYLGRLQTGIPAPILTVTYDSLRNLIYAEDGRGNVYAVDLRTGHSQFMFTSPTASGGIPGSLSYDPSIDRFRGVGDQGLQLLDIARDGRVTFSCNAPAVAASAPSGPPDPNQIVNPPNEIPGTAAVVAAGDGTAYLEMEDDQTVVHVDGSCNLLQQFVHATYAEASDENDSMACDTTTFPVPAIWMRDSSTTTVTAYEVPGGYCALSTRLTLTGGVQVAAGRRAPVCSTLTLAGNGRPVAAQQVDYFVANRQVGSGTTGGTGRSCVTFHAPAMRPRAGLPHTATVRAVRTVRAVTSPVLAVFLGTIAFRPASARGELGVVPPLVVPPVPPARVLLAAPPALAILPGPPPPPAPPAAPKPQAIAQAHPGAQPGVVGQPGAAADSEDEAEHAAQTADESTHEYSARQAFQWPAVETSAWAMAAALLEMRRRRSRVREQRA